MWLASGGLSRDLYHRFLCLLKLVVGQELVSVLYLVSCLTPLLLQGGLRLVPLLDLLS